MSYKFAIFLLILRTIRPLVAHINNVCDLKCNISNMLLENSVCLNKPCKAIAPCQLHAASKTNSFRQTILDLHNRFRSKIAYNEDSNDLPQASNMHIVNYDLGLETTALCNENALKCISKRDVCRRTAAFKDIFQNVGFLATTRHSFDVKKVLEKIVQRWYAELFRVEKLFLMVNDETSNIAQLARAEITHVGCALFFEHIDVLYQDFYLVCNYGSLITNNNKNVTFESSAQLYKNGTPCSACSYGSDICNEEYKGLCGKMLKLPIPISSKRKKNEKVLENAALTLKTEANFYLILVMICINMIIQL